MSQAKPSTPDRVVVFGTCLIDVMFPHAGLAAMRMLRAAGLEVRYPLAQTCCGQPAYNSGFRDDARRVARLQLDALAGDEPVVVPSASCAGMLREHYPRLFNGTADAARARQLAGRVFEF
jgi:L-lactate dehydrogenase complex protein LldE